MQTVLNTDNFEIAMTPDIPPNGKAERSDDDYVIDALAKGLQVLEALKGHAYEPVSIAYLSKQTGRSYDFCRRAIKTLKVRGWAIEDDRGFRLSVKAMQFSENFLAFAASLPATTIPKFQNPPN